MSTNIISKTLSRIYYHPTKAKERADAYAEKMKDRGYEVHIRESKNVYPPYYTVDVVRKK